MTDPKQELAKYEKEPLTLVSPTGAGDSIMAFINLAAMAKCCDGLEYSFTEETTTLIQAARNNEEPALQLAAIKMLHARRLDALKHAGVIGTTTATAITADGVKHTLTTNIVAGALQTVQTYPSKNNKESHNESEEVSPQEETHQSSGNPLKSGPVPVVDEAPLNSDQLPGLAGPRSGC